MRILAVFFICSIIIEKKTREVIMRFDIRTLQQGKRIIGATEGEQAGLTKNSVGAITTAYIMWLAKKLDKPVFTLRICVGGDERPSTQELKEGVMTGVQMTGSRNWDAGITTTDAIAAAPIMPYFEFDGSVMVTGGNNPDDINGLQFFTAEGPVDEDTVASMLDKAFKFAFIGEWFECEPVNLMQMYAAEQRRAISEGLAGYGGNLKEMKISVDAKDSMGEYFASEVLEKLGAEITSGANDADLALKIGIAMEIYTATVGGLDIDNSMDIEELIIEEMKKKHEK